jgi:signal transduction histidine kinase
VDGSDEDRVRLSVHNDGVIAEEVLPRLFDPFRTTHVRGAASNGLGLGLYIVREVVHSHGGTIHVTSTPVEGTTLTIELPRHVPATASIRSDPPPSL